MYITQAKEYTKWWKYLIGAVIVFAALFIFSIPHAIAIGVKLASGGLDPTRLEDVNYLMQAFEPNLNLIFVLLPFVGMLLGTFLAVRYVHGQPLLKLTTTRNTVDWNRAAFAFILWGAFTSFMLLIDYTVLSPENYQWNFKLQPFLILCVIAAILLPIQTSAEEYLFRGYLMQGIGGVFKYKWIALLLTSIGFGLLHYMNPEVERFGDIVMIYYIGTGLFLGIITLMDEGLELALGFHAANNLFTALLVSAEWTALQTHSVLKDISPAPESMPLEEVIVPVFVIFPILIMVFARKYGWTNWNERLFGKV
tara:strand:+ start:394 stop:1320 length:927 start_codon:yes stop_codon:yes gene_type:complete